MRLKEFIIFIVIFTIIYIAAFVIYDYFSDKKSNKNSSEKKDSIFSYDSFLAFAKFYGIVPNTNIETIKAIQTELANNFNITLSDYSAKYSLQPVELVVIILFLEYYDFIKKRSIVTSRNCTEEFNAKDSDISLKYSLYLSNKFDYNTIVQRAGLNSEEELQYLDANFLVPGVRIVEKNIYYSEGDSNEI